MYIVQIYWEICMMKRLFDGYSIHKKHDYANIMLSMLILMQFTVYLQINL